MTNPTSPETSGVEEWRSLKQLRKRLGFTLRDVELSTAGRVSNAYLSQLENGKIGSPSLEIALALAAVYCASLEEIAGALKIEMPPPPPRCPTCDRPFIDRTDPLA